MYSNLPRASELFEDFNLWFNEDDTLANEFQKEMEANGFQMMVFERPPSVLQICYKTKVVFIWKVLDIPFP